MVTSANREYRALVISHGLSSDSGFRQTLSGAGIFIHTASSETEALRVAVQRIPGVVVIELSGEPLADQPLLKFADDYTRSHDAAVLLFSRNQGYRMDFPGARTGSVRWIEDSECGPDCLAHMVVDAAGCLQDFDRECELRFGSGKAVGDTIHESIKKVRQVHANWLNVPDDQKAEHVDDLIESVNRLAGDAEVNGLAQMRQVALAIAGLAEKVRVIPQRMNISISRTIGQAVDLLPLLTSDVELGSGDTAGQPAILVLDDIAMIRRLHCSALESVNLSAVAMDDPVQALELIDKRHFDLVFLDIHMPMMHGSVANAQTPAIFVSGLRDVETRDRSQESGGVDFIAKPVLQYELGLKALIHLHLARRKKAA